VNGVIVADASPPHYLILIDCAGGLPELFEHVLIPSIVGQFLCLPGKSSTDAPCPGGSDSNRPWGNLSAQVEQNRAAIIYDMDGYENKCQKETLSFLDFRSYRRICCRRLRGEGLCPATGARSRRAAAFWPTSRAAVH
jgi:hypothetical protein